MPGAGDISALQLLVPGAEPLLDAVRALPGVALLEPAHISLGYPWRPAADAAASVPELIDAAAGVTEYDTRLLGPRTFAADGRGRRLVHVVPEDQRPVRVLAERLRADLREVHLSVARLTPDADVEAVEAAVRPLLPLAVRIDVLELTLRVDGRWEPGGRFPLAARQ